MVNKLTKQGFALNPWSIQNVDDFKFSRELALSVDRESMKGFPTIGPATGLGNKGGFAQDLKRFRLNRTGSSVVLDENLSK